ncbi:MAG: GspH/FimT family pseudopilin [Cellvibrionales bacterium]|nr:GspH/FimT family pseudopilin [Cellvibrionales bacterium]
MRYTKGFTLVELLAVLVIVGLAASLTVISLGRGFGQDNLDTFTKQLRNTLAFAAEEAVLFRHQTGVIFDLETVDDQSRYSYQFVILDEKLNRWAESEDPDLKKGLFPQDVELTIAVEGEELTIGAQREAKFFISKKKSDGKDEEGKSLVPDVIFFSSGEAQPFTITLRAGEGVQKEYTISSSILGQITLKQPGDEDD